MYNMYMITFPSPPTAWVQQLPSPPPPPPEYSNYPSSSLSKLSEVCVGVYSVVRKCIECRGLETWRRGPGRESWRQQQQEARPPVHK